jgi:uncharacterized protein YcbK (DUF882 family)
VGDLTKNLSRSEFRCKCGKCEFVAADHELVNVIQKAVDDLGGKRVIVTSGIRCAAHNKAVGGSPKSQHVTGLAADIAIDGITPQKLYDYLDNAYPDKYGIGLYKTWTHIDVRKGKARWTL